MSKDDKSSLHHMRVPLLLRLGITGHSKHGKGRVPIDEAALEGRLTTILEQAETRARAVFDETVFENAEPILRFTSGLAPGADTLAAKIALARGWELQAVLPFAADLYRENFTDPADLATFNDLLARAARVTEFDFEKTTDQARAYERIGDVVIEQSDVLIAIWDGEEAHGKGGTGGVVEEAIGRGTIVARLDPRGTEPVELSQYGARLTRCGADCAELTDAIGTLLAPPGHDAGAHHEDEAEELSEAHHHGHHEDPRSRLDRFLSRERPHRKWRWTAYDLLRKFATGRPFRLTKTNPGWRLDEWDSYGNWRDLLKEAPESAPEADIVARLGEPHARADHLGLHMSDVYRSAYVLNFMLAAIAVLVGLLGLLTSINPDLTFPGKWPFVLGELIVILTIVTLTGLGTRRGWHSRWLDYRQLAEILRQARMGALLGRSSGPSLTDESAQAAGTRWVAWLSRSLIRAVPPPSGRLDPESVRKAVDVVVAKEIDEQIRFNTGSWKSNRKISHFLEFAAETLFYGTLVIGLLYFVTLFVLEVPHQLDALKGHHPPAASAPHIEESHAAHDEGFDPEDPHKGTPSPARETHEAEPENSGHEPAHETTADHGDGGHHGPPWKPWVKYIGAILMGALPAFGAAFAGIRAQGDFDGYAHTARQTAYRLDEVRRRLVGEGLLHRAEGPLKLAPDLQPVSRTGDYDAAIGLFEDASAAMNDDLSSWRALYQRRPLTNP